MELRAGQSPTEKWALDQPVTSRPFPIPDSSLCRGAGRRKLLGLDFFFPFIFWVSAADFMEMSSPPASSLGSPCSIGFARFSIDPVWARIVRTIEFRGKFDRRGWSSGVDSFWDVDLDLNFATNAVFSEVLPVFSWFRLASNGFFNELGFVELGFTEFYWVSALVLPPERPKSIQIGLIGLLFDFIGFCWVSPSFTWSNWVLPSFWALLGFYSMLPGFLSLWFGLIEFLVGFISLHWVFTGFRQV